MNCLLQFDDSTKCGTFFRILIKHRAVGVPLFVSTIEYAVERIADSFNTYFWDVTGSLVSDNAVALHLGIKIPVFVGARSLYSYGLNSG